MLYHCCILPVIWANVAGYGGTIYCGIGKDRQVFGLPLTRDDKDQFRLGIDRMMMDTIEPVIFHSQFHVHAIPVLDPNTGDEIPDLFVIGNYKFINAPLNKATCKQRVPSWKPMLCFKPTFMFRFGMRITFVPSICPPQPQDHLD